jgi:excisionase family DNA binding protein
MFTLGTAAKHVGKSKPTISKAIKDGKLSATKVNGVYQIDPSELSRAFPSTAITEAITSPKGTISTSVPLALSEQRNAHLEAAVGDLKARLDDMKAERDQALQDAREDRNKVMALLEDQRPKSFWSRMFK